MSPILRIVLIARGSAAPDPLAPLAGLLPPWTPPFSSPTLRLRRTVDEPGGPQLPRFARLAATPLDPISNELHMWPMWRLLIVVQRETVRLTRRAGGRARQDA